MIQYVWTLLMSRVMAKGEMLKEDSKGMFSLKAAKSLIEECSMQYDALLICICILHGVN